jgi:F0F1-type ATP synthase membrane subunit a
VWWLFPLMIPIEIVGNLAKPLSLTLRLVANMYAGEQITNVFITLTKLIDPRVHGVSYFRFILAGIYFNAADYGLCQRRGDSRRALIPAPLVS